MPAPRQENSVQEIKDFFREHDLFARHCGIELVEVGPGRARVQMAIQPCHFNGAGTVHGGAIFTLADFAFAVASNSRGQLAMGINTSTSFIKAARSGILFAEAQEISLNRQLGNYQVRITDEQEQLIALFQGTVFRKEQALFSAG
jgi:acyl-CoA thioesterase